MGFIIFAIVGGAIVGILLVPIVLPIIIVNDNKKIKEIKRRVDDFGLRKFENEDEKEVERKKLLRELIEIKGKITDKNLKQEAADVMSLL